MEGVWVKHDLVARISAEPGKPQSLTFSVLTDSGWSTNWTGIRLRTDGRFQATASYSFTTITAGDRRYLVYRYVAGNGFYRNVLLFAQKLKPQADLAGLAGAHRPRVGRGERPGRLVSVHWHGRPALAIGEIPGLAGWVTVTCRPATGSSRSTRRAATASAPCSCRSRRGRATSRTPSSSRTAPTSGSGGAPPCTARWTRWRRSPPARTRDVRADAHTEWRSVTAASTLQIAGGTAWVLYDGDFNVLGKGTTSPAETHAPTGAYLALFAAASTNATVTVVPD